MCEKQESTPLLTQSLLLKPELYLCVTSTPKPGHVAYIIVSTPVLVCLSGGEGNLLCLSTRLSTTLD